MFPLFWYAFNTEKNILENVTGDTLYLGVYRNSTFWGLGVVRRYVTNINICQIPFHGKTYVLF